ncbi:MAG TPA: MFS transporter [Xanthobacteraceae bacterium]|nr:MFS transporter [Xanthobacteraceae bacterium]
MSRSVETGRSWVVASLSLVALAFSFGAIWISVVALKPMAAELGGARSVPALATALAWFGTGVGGIAMGWFADRFGVRWTVLFGSLMIAIGLTLSSFGEVWQIYLGHGLFIGLLGNAGFNAPLNVYVSRWFDRRRGSALALIASGQYIAGAIWPPIFDRAIAAYGWRATMFGFALCEMLVILPVALLVLKRAPEVIAPPPAASGAAKPRVLGWPPNLVFAMLALAAFCCCMPMSMPQSHIVALCSDLGIKPTHGAAMLSLLLGTAFLARQMWGWISDRIGGLFTLLIGSTWQFLAITALTFTQDEIGLFTVTGFFGLGFSGLIPAYVLVIRELFPSRDAGWRVPVLLCFSGFGMASGGWFAGILYDHFGYYAPAFAAGLIFNAVNLLLIGPLVLRHIGSSGGARAATAYG